MKATSNSKLMDKQPRKIRIVLADDHPLMRQAIRMWLETQQDMEVVAEARDGKEAMEIAGKLYPDVIIMDISMPKLGGMEATKQITSKCPGTEVLALTVHNDIEHVHGMLQAGASGYLMKTVPGEEVIHAVRAIYAGEHVLPSVESQDGMHHAVPLQRDNLNELTDRELRILKYIANGLSNKGIAIRLELSLRSVKANITSIFIKLGAVSRTEAISIGLRSGIFTLDDLKQNQ